MLFTAFLLDVVHAGRSQAHLPLAHGLPPIPATNPPTAQYAGDALPNYYSPAALLLGGSRTAVINAAVRDSPYAVPQPFHEWDVNHVSGPSVFDCPEGFTLTSENTCVFLEYRHPEESCPYGTFKDRSSPQSACVHIDSVPPDRTCPAGFEYFMRGCIRRTQIAPIMTCPPGYSQLENVCYSVSSVPPQMKCPNGRQLVKTESDLAYCRNEATAAPLYTCPPGINARLVAASQTDVARMSLAGAEWSLSSSIPQCVVAEESDPVAICPTDYKLVVANTDVSTRDLPMGVSDVIHTEAELDNLRCVKIVEYEGRVECPSGYRLSGSSALTDPPRCEPMWGAALHSSNSTAIEMFDEGVDEHSLRSGLSADQRSLLGVSEQIPVVKFDRASCHLTVDGVTWKESVDSETLRPICREVHSLNPQLACPIAAKARCLAVSEVAPTEQRRLLSSVARRKKLSSNSLPSQSTDRPDQSLMRTLTSSTSSVGASDVQDAELQACLRVHKARPVCVGSETLLPAVATCADSTASLTSRPMEGVLDDKNYRVAVCVATVVEEPYLECPFGVGNVGQPGGRCDVLLAQPLSVSCPEGYTKATHEKSAVISLLGDTKTLNKKSLFPAFDAQTVESGGVCELVEYADYQITCPAGYRRERAKNTAAACLAEKLLPVSILCPPGYLPNGEGVPLLGNSQGCVKRVVVAPTIISYPSESLPPSDKVDGGGIATACVLTKDKKLSCGVERKYHGMIDYYKQRAFGETFKAKQDRKTRQHTDKYSTIA